MVVRIIPPHSFYFRECKPLVIQWQKHEVEDGGWVSYFNGDIPEGCYCTVSC